GPIGLAVSPDATRVYVADEFNFNAAVLDLVSGGAVLAIGPGSSVTSTSASPFIAVNGSTLTADNLLLLQGSLSLAGPLFEATSSTVTFAKSAVRVFDGGTLVTQSPAGITYPLVKLNGGSLTVGTPGLAG